MSDRKSSKPSERHGTPGRGGPGTYAGANFQTIIGVYEAVRLLGSLSTQPWQSSTISAEPRQFGPTGQVGYDIALDNTARRVEVKRAPTRADVRDFLGAVSDDPADRDGETVFEFVHGRSSRAAADLKEVARTAQEAIDDADFARLVSHMPADEQDLVSKLGDNPWKKARQIRVTYRSMEDTRTQVEFITDRMYGARPAVSVRDRLAAHFANAAESRQSFDVADIRDDLAAIGGRTQLGPVADLTGLPPVVQDALAILAAVEYPLPVTLLASSIGCDERLLLEGLGALVRQVEVSDESAVILTTPLGGVSHGRSRDLLASTLRHLLDLTTDRAKRRIALTQATNISALAERIIDFDPQLVSRVYPVAEKLFKTTGNLQLALTTSRLSLRASEKVPVGASAVTNQQLHDRAQTKICGESWVLQRIGALDAADTLAQESLELGERLGWARNTAYCLKCRGRLSRMRAESTDIPEDRANLLIQSEQLLRDAIDAFKACDEFGADHPEVGDCRSLLARTLFVAGRRPEAWKELLAAQDRLQGERGQKDWADALILEAEMLAREGDERGTLARLDEVFAEFPVTSTDSDATEISARALALRARARTRLDPEGAGADFGLAATLYESLEDHQRADEQTWAQLVVTGGVPADLQADLVDEPVGVRVAAVAIFRRDYSSSSARAVGQRRGLSPASRRQIVGDARLDSDRRELRWQ